MGVRSLPLLLHEAGLFRQEELANSHLVVDGTNLLFVMMEFWADRIWVGLGIDYDAFSWLVERFFQDLELCQITPIVILDGAWSVVDRRTFQRHRDSVSAGRRPVRELRGVADDVLLMPLLVQTLRRRRVPVARSDGDADLAIVALVRRLNCPVLSDDSDLWLLGVTTVGMRHDKLLLRRPRIRLRNRAAHTRYTLNVTVMRPQVLLEHFGIAKEMLTLFWVLASKREVCKPFVDTLTIDPDLANDDRHFLQTIFDWLRQQGSLQEAVVLQTIFDWLRQQGSLQEAVETVALALKKCDSKKFRAYVTAHQNMSWGVMPLNFLEESAPELYEQLQAAPAGRSAAGDEACGAHKYYLRMQMNWVRPSYRRLMCQGLVNGLVLSSVHCAQRLNPRPAVEDGRRPAAVLCAAPLLVLLQQLLGAPAGCRQLVVRRGRRLQLLVGWSPWRAPLLERALLWPSARRRALLLSMVDVRRDVLSQLAGPLQLLTLALVHWRRHSACSADTRRHLFATLVSWMAVVTPEDARDVLDPEVIKNVQRRLQESIKNKQGRLQESMKNKQGSQRGQFHEQLFDLSKVHVQYEHQFVFRTVMDINNALAEPLPTPPVDRMFCGPVALYVGRELCAATTPDPDTADASEDKLEAGVQRMLDSRTAARAVRELVDTIELEAEHGHCRGEHSAAYLYRPPQMNRDQPPLHDDLQACRRLTLILNRATPGRWRDTLAALRRLNVTTELGLYCLAAAVCERALRHPSEAALCAWTIGQLRPRRVRPTSDQTPPSAAALRADFITMVQQILHKQINDAEYKYGLRLAAASDEGGPVAEKDLLVANAAEGVSAVGDDALATAAATSSGIAATPGSSSGSATGDLPITAAAGGQPAAAAAAGISAAGVRSLALSHQPRKIHSSDLVGWNEGAEPRGLEPVTPPSAGDAAAAEAELIAVAAADAQLTLAPGLPRLVAQLFLHRLLSSEDMISCMKKMRDNEAALRWLCRLMTECGPFISTFVFVLAYKPPQRAVIGNTLKQQVPSAVTTSEQHGLAGETLSGQQRSSDETMPEQQGPSTATMPEQQGPSTATISEQQGPSTATLSEQKGPSCTTISEQQGPSTATISEQQGPSTATLSEQKGPSTATISEQQGPSTDTMPEQQGPSGDTMLERQGLLGGSHPALLPTTIEFDSSEDSDTDPIEDPSFTTGCPTSRRAMAKPKSFYILQFNRVGSIGKPAVSAPAGGAGDSTAADTHCWPCGQAGGVSGALLGAEAATDAQAAGDGAEPGWTAAVRQQRVAAPARPPGPAEQRHVQSAADCLSMARWMRAVARSAPAGRLSAPLRRRLRSTADFCRRGWRDHHQWTRLRLSAPGTVPPHPTTADSTPHSPTANELPLTSEELITVTPE